MPSSTWKKESIGKVVNIDQPEIVNVQLISNKKELGEIIPFRRISTKEPMKAYLKHASSTTKNFFTNSVPSVLDHEVQQGCVFTYNKLQGATIDRLILVLCNITKYKLGDMSIHKLYVALSRVRNRKHLAIFNVKDEDLEYLLKKRYLDRFVAWYGNYDTNGN